MKTVDIFIKSYHKDFKLLNYSFISLKRFVTGYNKVILLIPEHEKHLFDTRDLPERTEVHYVKEYGDKYLLQQWFKVSANKYSNADFILFSDSDVIFDHEVNVMDYVSNNTPQILYTHYDKVGTAIIWKQCTEAFLNTQIDFEFMRRLQLIYHRETLIKISQTYPNLEFSIMNNGRFSEFNFIGAWAFINEREKYDFINTDDWSYVPPMGIQLWSRADKNGDQQHRDEYKRSIDTINRVLELNISEL